MNDVTIVITPRDRYSGVLDCISTLYACTEQSFDLLVLDLGYPIALLQATEAMLKGRSGATIVPLGRIIPMEAFARIRDRIKTPYTVFLDNDSRVTPGWLPPLLACAREENAALILPLTLEREGVDKGPASRNHVYTSELRIVDVQGTPYLIEHKPYRRAVQADIPLERAPTDLFEFHCVMFETAVLQALDMPMMVIREHIDIGMQIQAMGRKRVAEPRSVVVFDNLNQRMALSDILFFFFRWSKAFAENSSRMFEKRWGYNFYSEQSMMNWIVRRKVYLLARWLWLPSSVANKLSNAYKKLFLKDWDPIKDPIRDSVPFYETLPGGVPMRKDQPIDLARNSEEPLTHSERAAIR